MRTYRLVRRIGAGGMGEVYEGRMQTSLGPDMPCAIKLILRKHSDDPTYKAMFARESQTALAMNHENLVKTYDAGIASDGRLFLVMELVRGPDLRAAAETLDGQFAVLRLIVLDILAALGYLHTRSVIHRDVTPRNIMIDSTGRARLGDLGIVKRASGTGVRGVCGVPAYASPEMRAGTSTTAATDLYSLGAVLFELLTGRTLLGPKSDDSTESGESYEESVELPPLFDVGPPDLVKLIGGLLREKPGERLTIDDALDLIEQSGEPIATHAELADLMSSWFEEDRPTSPGQDQPTPIGLEGVALQVVREERATAKTAKRARRRTLALVAAVAVVGFAAGSLSSRSAPTAASPDQPSSIDAQPLGERDAKRTGEASQPDEATEPEDVAGAGDDAAENEPKQTGDSNAHVDGSGQPAEPANGEETGRSNARSARALNKVDRRVQTRFKVLPRKPR